MSLNPHCGKPKTTKAASLSLTVQVTQKEAPKSVKPRSGISRSIQRIANANLVGEDGAWTIPRARNPPPTCKQCLMVVNLPESKEFDSQTRLNHKINLLRKTLRRLFIPGEETSPKNICVKSVFYLGKLANGSSGSTRPLKVVLGSEGEAASLFQRAHRLKGERIRILRDLDRVQREQLRKALSKLHERSSNGEVNLVIRASRVQKRRPYFRGRPLLIAYPTTTPEYAIRRGEEVCSRPKRTRYNANEYQVPLEQEG
ncbi:unnamed protein product [Echinostoma caproni]|uniref:Uncharacterized protein n=1 Tax=Echinostoma caproni TaxID=27848 RepID=A0A183ARN4_9TREM|nr:unnamed protein product [Echinostoma caproni]